MLSAPHPDLDKTTKRDPRYRQITRHMKYHITFVPEKLSVGQVDLRIRQFHAIRPGNTPLRNRNGAHEGIATNCDQEFSCDFGVDKQRWPGFGS